MAKLLQKIKKMLIYIKKISLFKTKVNTQEKSNNKPGLQDLEDTSYIFTKIHKFLHNNC